MKFEVAEHSLSSHDNAISKLIEEYNADHMNLQQCLATLGNTNIQTSIHHLFKLKSNGDLLSPEEMEKSLSKSYWLKFHKEIPLNLITSKEKLCELHDLFLFGEIQVFNLTNIQALIANLYEEKFNVKGRELANELINLNRIDSVSLKESSKLPVELVVIKNQYSLTNTNMSNGLKCIDAIRLAVKEDLHLTLAICPFDIMIKHADKLGSDWISIDMDLMRFKVQPNNLVQIVFSDKAMKVIAKNIHSIQDLDLMVEWVANTYTPNEFLSSDRQFYKTDILALTSILENLHEIDLNSELKIPYSSLIDELVLLQLIYPDVFTVLTKGLNSANTLGYHQLKINQSNLPKLIKDIYIGFNAKT